MPNPANTPAQQDERINGLPALPAGTDRATLTVPVFNPATNKTHEAPLVADDGATTSNAVVGGHKFVRYRDSRLNGVPATALTLDRLKPATIVPQTQATVFNPSNTPLTTSEPPRTYEAKEVAPGTAGAVMVPRFIGAAASDTVPIIWQELATASTGGPFQVRTYWPVIFLTHAEAVAWGRPNCLSLDQIPNEFLCSGSTARVDLHPDKYGQNMLLIYDDRPNQMDGIRAYIDGNFQRYYDMTVDGLNPQKWVKDGSPEAATASIKRYDPAYAKWAKDQTMKIDIGGTDAFFSAINPGGPFPAPTAAGVATADWKPAAKPQAQDLSPIVAQHTQQLATIATQSSPVYGFLKAGGAPVGYTSIDDALADPQPKTSQTFNTALLVLTKSNPATGTGWAYATAALGRTLQFGNNVELTLPGDDAGSLTFQDFYIEQAPGARGGKVRLLTKAPDTTPPALLPRLSGYCGKPLEFVNGGAALLSGYYGSLTGTGTAFVVEPFQADNVAATVKVVRLGGGGGSGSSYTDAQAAAAALASLIAGNNQHQGVEVQAVGGVPKLIVAGLFTDIIRMRMPAPGSGNLAEGTDFRDANTAGLYKLTNATNVARLTILKDNGPSSRFDDALANFPTTGVGIEDNSYFTYRLLPIDATQPVSLELTLTR